MKLDPLEPVIPDLASPDFDRDVQQYEKVRHTRRFAWMLSLASAVPLAVLVLLIAVLEPVHPIRPLLLSALATYGAVLLSFLGGIRWGLAMGARKQESTRRIFAMSVAPVLVGWFSLMLPAPHLFAVQLLAFAGQGAWDSLAGQASAFGLWFVRLRTIMTLLVCALLAMAFFLTV